MFRVLIVAFFVVCTYAQTIHFQEEKYIAAFENTFYKKGILEFEKESIRLQYTTSDKVLVYENDSLFVLKKEKKEPFSSQSKSIVKMIFLLIDSIYKDDFESLEEFFILTKEKNVVHLKPKEMLSSYIKMISFEKEESLKYLTLSMQNGNITTIRQLNE